MTEDRLPLAELLQKAGDGDFLRAVAEAVLQLLMEADVEGLIGAGRYERSPERLNHRKALFALTVDRKSGVGRDGRGRRCARPILRRCWGWSNA
jgi:transposase-like protein